MILVTGAAGFIGSNLIAELERRGHTGIIGCDFLGHDERWNNLCKRDMFDIINPDRLFSHIEQYKSQIQIVFHLGAISSTDATDGDLVLNNNYRLSLDLFHLCARHRIRFIYASSAATYGGGELGFLDSEEDMYLSKLRPMNLYGWSKHAFDRTLLQHKRSEYSATPPQWAGLKFFNVYGPNEHHKKGQSSVIPHFARQIQESGVANLFESGRSDIPHGFQKRDFVSVHDAVDVMIWLMENGNVSGLFNVGTGQARTFLDLAKAVFQALNMPEKIEFIPLPEKLAKHYQYFTEADMGKLRASGYAKPMLSLEEGVRDYVQNYLLKDDPYR